jgi:hypothetical protein
MIKIGYEKSIVSGCLLIQNGWIIPIMNTMLSAHARISAMLETEPSCPARGIPHTGLTPTGATRGSAEELANTVGACFKIYETG